MEAKNEPFAVVPEVREEAYVKASLKLGLTAEQIHQETGIALDRVRVYIRRIQGCSHPVIVPSASAFGQAAAAARVRPARKRGGQIG
jgi:hypothetical protein